MRALPAAGYDGPMPDWPAGRAPTKAALAVWETLWRRPQASAWVDLGFEYSVARLAQLMVQAMKPDATAVVLGEVRQLEDRLGLNPAAMQRLRWEVEQPEDAEVHTLRPAASEGRRLSAVDPE